jgi:ribosome modulation factor
MKKWADMYQSEKENRIITGILITVILIFVFFLSWACIEAHYTYKKAYQEGLDAAVAGLVLEDCPYGKPSCEINAWESGFKRGLYEVKMDKALGVK